MSNAIAKLENTALATMDEGELLTVLQSSLYPGASLPSIKLVLGYCKAAGLDPMQKPVHIVPMWDKHSKSMRDVIMPGVGLYRTNAARTNELAGISEPEFGPVIPFAGINVPEFCRVTVKRLIQGAERSFTAVEYWAENYATAGKDSSEPNSMWRKRPRGQLAKCTQAQALRMAFPEATGSQPTADEMEGKTLTEEYAGTTVDAGTGEITKPVAPAAPTALPPYSDEAFQKNLTAWHGLIESGKKTADQIIAMVSSKATMSEEQMAMVRATVIDMEPA